MTADGNWSLVVASPIGQRPATLSVTTGGSTLKGSQEADGNSTEIFDGTRRWQCGLLEGLDRRPDADDARI